MSHRSLRLPAPEHHQVPGWDGKLLRLTHYAGGAKGPLVLVHGLAEGSTLFVVPTVETNLAEFFVAAGYDLWLLDGRCSSELAWQTTSFTLDDLAADFQPVVQAVRGRTGAEGVQVLAHGLGGVSLLMALLDGLEGVRSVLCNQAGFYLELPAMKRLMAGMQLPSVLKAVGVRTLAIDAGPEPAWADQLLDLALAVGQWEEPCRCAACQRLAFVFGGMCNVERLNGPTHAALGSLFGETHLSAFEHMALLGWMGRLVDAKGRDRYLPGVGRLSMPIGLTVADGNRAYGPGGIERTYRALCEAHGAGRHALVPIKGYGLLDSLIGKDAARDVFPLFLAELERQEANG